MSDFDKPDISPSRPEAALLFLVFSFEEQEIYYKVRDECEKRFSEILYESPPLPKWTHNSVTNPYPFTGRLTRILTFRRKISREELPVIQRDILKLQEMAWKKDASFHVVPGYVTPNNLVISSLYEDSHRIYLYKSVFAEIVYRFESQKLICADTAPAFFQTREANYFFTNLREAYVQTL